jgi:hypothetical protein
LPLMASEHMCAPNVPGDKHRDVRTMRPMSLNRENGKIVLRGTMRDQAELQAFFQRISDLGLRLLSVSALENGPPA